MCSHNYEDLADVTLAGLPLARYCRAMPTTSRTQSFRPTTPLVASILLALLPATALAQPVKVSDADFATLQKLRFDAIIKDVRMTFAHTEDQKAAVKAKWDKALADSKWDQEKFTGARDAVEEAVNALNDLAKGGDEAENAKENINNMDKGTVEVVRAHLKEWVSDQALREKATKQWQEEMDQERRGRAPEAKDLEGTWTFDLDATVEQNAAGMGDDVKAKMRETFAKTMKTAIYTFGPGDAIVSTVDQGAGERTDKGTYRLEGGKLFIKSPGMKKEMSVDIGMKQDKLNIGLMGIYSVFKKK